jgi:hypothetical protein
VIPLGWIEGIELDFFGGVPGLDIRRPALAGLDCRRREPAV